MRAAAASREPPGALRRSQPANIFLLVAWSDMSVRQLTCCRVNVDFRTPTLPIVHPSGVRHWWFPGRRLHIMRLAFSSGGCRPRDRRKGLPRLLVRDAVQPACLFGRGANDSHTSRLTVTDTVLRVLPGRWTWAMVDPIGEKDISQLFDTVSGRHVLEVTLVSLISLLQACSGHDT